MTQLNSIRHHTALLIMDYQIEIINRNVKQVKVNTLLDRTAALLLSARTAQIPILYVMVAFRPNYPEINDRNPIFSSIEEQGLFLLNAADTQIHPKVAPTRNDPVIIKHRYGAFTATDLDMILRAQHIDTLIMAGISTSGVVLTTVRQAFDLDYNLYVVKDCCVDANPEVHNDLITRILPLQANVVSANEVIAIFKKQ